MIRLAAAVLFVVGWAATASAQSLADVARKEEARRKHVTKPVPGPDQQGSQAVRDPAFRPPARSKRPRPGTPQSRPSRSRLTRPRTQQARDEQTWREQMAKARAGARALQMYLDALQSRINALVGRFHRRATIRHSAPRSRRDRQKALAELDRVKREIEDQKKAIADLQEEARKRRRASRLAAVTAAPAPRRPRLPSSSSKTRTRCARCCATRSRRRATASSRPRDETEAISRCARRGPTWSSPTCGCPSGDGFGVLRAAKDSIRSCRSS